MDLASLKVYHIHFKIDEKFQSLNQKEAVTDGKIVEDKGADGKQERKLSMPSKSIW